MCQELNLPNISNKRVILAQYLLVFACAGLLYVLTCAPTILWHDSGGAVYRISHNNIEGNGGLAASHPLFFILGISVKYLPFGDLAYKINLISAVFGAITIANLFLLLRLWLDKFLPAIIGAFSLAFSWTFWQHSVVAEVYSIYTALLMCELVLLLQYIRTKKVFYLYTLGLVNGFAIAEHMWAIFGLSCYGLFLIYLLIKKQIKLKHISVFVLLWIIGASSYLYLIIKNIIFSGDITATLSSVFFGDMWKAQVLNASVSKKIILENMIFLILNFPTPNFLLFFVGVYCLYKYSPTKSFANILLFLAILFYVFAFRYTVADRHVFFLPFYCMVAVIVGLGANVFIRRNKSGLLIPLMVFFTLLPISVYCIAPAVARKTYKSIGQRRQLPYRNDYKYFLQPWKNGYRGAERYANEAFEIAAPNSIIYVDHTAVHPLLYMQQVKGRRSDLKIVSKFDSSIDAPEFKRETISELIENFTVYVVSPISGYCPGFLIDNYDFTREGILWRVNQHKCKVQ